MCWAAGHAPGMAAFRDGAPQAQRDHVFGSYQRVREELARRGGLDAVVICSNEHFTNFFLDNFPQTCIGLGERHFGPVERWLGMEQGWIPGQPALAAHLLSEALGAGFEPAFSHELRLDHGVVTVYTETDPSRSLPLVPIIQNCAVAPMLPLRRCFEFGVALGDAVRSFPEDLRVGVMGAGGLSHSVGTPSVGDIDEDFDRWFLDRLAAGDVDAICAVPDDELSLAGNGAHEIRSWLTAAGVAAGAGGSGGEILAYEPVYAWICGMGTILFDLPAPARSGAAGLP